MYLLKTGTAYISDSIYCPQLEISFNSCTGLYTKMTHDLDANEVLKLNGCQMFRQQAVGLNESIKLMKPLIKLYEITF